MPAVGRARAISRYTPENVLVLLPAFNEETRIVPVIEAVRSMRFPVLVVDDGSKDATAERSKAAGAELIKLRENGGKGGAMRRGFDWFLGRGYAAVVMMDADGQHDPQDLWNFLSALDSGADFVIGNRMTDLRGMSILRRATNKFMSALLSRKAGIAVPDTQCGYRAITRQALRDMRLTVSRFEIESEMILQASEMGLTVRSVPVRTIYGTEKSRIRPVRDTLRFFSFLRKREQR